MLIIEPAEPILYSVRLHQAYRTTVTLKNQSRNALELTIRAGSPERWAVAPATVFLEAGRTMVGAVQVDRAWVQRFKLKHVDPVPNVASKFNLRPYTMRVDLRLKLAREMRPKRQSGGAGALRVGRDG